MLSDVRLLRPSTRAVLDGGKYTALIRADGQFELYDFFFDTLSLDCTTDACGFLQQRHCTWLVSSRNPIRRFYLSKGTITTLHSSA